MAAEKQSWDGVERRKEQASVGVTGLNVAARAANDGKKEVEQIFQDAGESADRIVREGDLKNQPLRERVEAILNAAEIAIENEAQASNQNQSLKPEPKPPEAPAILTRSPEHMRQIEAFEAQYAIQTADLAKTGQSNERMPSRIQVVDSLTPEILKRALRIRNKFGGEPTGLLLADNDRHAKKIAIDGNKVPGQKHDTYFYDPDNVNLWNGGQPWPEKKEWGYLITDGQENIPNDPKIRGKNYPKIKAWMEKYAAENLGVLSGADPYLTLQRHALSKGKRIDSKTFTVLNAPNLTESSLVAYGFWGYDQVVLNNVYPDIDSAALRLRPAGRVPLKKLRL